MGLSDQVEQQRRREIATLKRFVGYSCAGAVLLHGIVLSLAPSNFWKPPKPPPTEVTIVPRRVPPVPEQSPEPPKLPEPEPESEPVSESPASFAELPELLLANTSTPFAPEGAPDVRINESPLVGSGLAPGTGGFSEGIGLNRSNSPVRGSGGGARRGIPGGGAPQTRPEPSVPEPAEPPVAAAPPPVLDVIPPAEDAGRRAVCRNCPAPNYPRSALQANVEGRVQVAVDLDERGRVVEVRLANSSGDPDIDAAVLDTVRERWRFESIRGGATNLPVEVYMTIDGSELNRQAESWGERTAVEIPAAGFATPVPTTVPAARPAADPTPSSDPPALPTEPEQSPESLPLAPERASSPGLESESTPALPAEPAGRTEPSNYPEPSNSGLSNGSAPDALTPDARLEPSEPLQPPIEVAPPSQPPEVGEPIAPEPTEFLEPSEFSELLPEAFPVPDALPLENEQAVPDQDIPNQATSSEILPE